ncbi:MAG: site-specific integrase [Bacteroidales bacterium]|nr:site-specific integrase [Bacteroidales bacterium]MBN2747900.1 site-specific integrase [Bacteroidales bacterium]
MAIKVTLREKIISNGRKSLYLDFYPEIIHPDTGKLTRREFLGMYVYIDKSDLKKHIKEQKQLGKNIDALKKIEKGLKPLTPIQEKHNADTIEVAESIKEKRQNQLKKPEIYSPLEKERLKVIALGEKCFVEYFRQMATKRKEATHTVWLSALNYLEEFTKDTGGSVKFADLNQSFFENFKGFLTSTKSKRSDKALLAQNSAVSYFNKVKAALKQAYKDGILQTDLNARIAPIKQAETKREYLTIEELNQLVKTPCNNILLKRAALFSALTGLRFSDIQKLTWGEIEYIAGEGYVLKFQQKKTKGIENLPISEQAVNLLGEPKNPTDSVFDGLTYSAYQNKHLFQWLGAAGITKNITFHCFRHTFATLQLYNGTDIYTVSKMLGHKDLKTTQVYAKIVDDAKRKAANRIKLDL